MRNARSPLPPAPTAALTPQALAGRILMIRGHGVAVFPSPVQAPTLTIKPYRHERYHQDPVSRWLRSMCAGLFAGRGVSPVAETGR